MAELDHAMSTLDEERAAKEKAEEELARFQAKAQEEVNRIRAKAQEDVARILADAKARTAQYKAEAQKVLDLANGQVKTERVRSATAAFMLKKAQRQSSDFLRLKASHKVVSLENRRLYNMTDAFFAP